MLRSMPATGATVLVVLALAACGSDAGSIGDGSATSDFCDYAREVDQSDFATDFGSDGDLTDADFEQLDEVFTNLGDRAPAELEDDIEIMRTNLRSIRDVFAEYDFDADKLTEAALADPELAEEISKFDDAEFEAASGRVGDYIEKTCGITGSS